MVLAGQSAARPDSNDEFRTEPVARRIFDSAKTAAVTGGQEVAFRALGTNCRILVGGSSASAATFFRSAMAWVAAFEAKYSRFLADSLISRINRSAGGDWVAIDSEAERMFGLCQELNFLSRGILDPTSLPVLALWNWKEPPVSLPTDEVIAAAMSLVGWRKVQRAPGKIRLPFAGMCLDLGGMGKEYAVDQIVLLAQRSGFRSVLADFGADIRTAGPPLDQRPAWHIGLEDPKSPGTCWTGLSIRESAVATSGDYIRKFELNGRRYGHIVDPRTGRPVSSGVRSVSVVAPSCTQAGFLSTAAFVLGDKEGLRLIESTAGVAGAIITENQTLQSHRFHELIPA